MDNPQPWTVTLTIPCAPEYVGTARLAMLGVAARLGFTYDEIEDIRLAVGEACTGAIERARQNGQEGAASSAMLAIRAAVEPAQLIIEVEDDAGSLLSNESAAEENDGMDSAELGALLMEILVDEVSLESRPKGMVVRLTKRVSAH